jgi:lysophospholipase L1-like esterase
MKFEISPGIRTEQIQRVIERRELGSPDSVVIHVGTNDLRRTRNLDYVMGDVYGLVNTANTKFSTSRVVFSGVLRRVDVSWRRVGAVDDRLEWVANTLGVTFVDPNSWMDDWDFSRDGLHLNRRGTRHLGKLYSRVCGIGGGRQKMRGD